MSQKYTSQRLRTMAERFPGPGYDLSSAALHEDVWNRIGPADDWGRDDDDQWVTFLLLVAEELNPAAGVTGTQ